MNRRALATLVVGGLAAALVGGLAGRAAASALDLPPVYSRALVAALLVGLVAYTERLNDRFDRAAYEGDRGLAGQALDLAAVAVAGLVGAAVGIALGRALGLSPGLMLVVVFGLGFLVGMAPFVARNRRYYADTG